MQSYYLFLLFFVPGCISYRFLRHGGVSVFNFSLYPLVCGYFYLLIPALIPVASSFEDTLSISANSFEVVDLLSVWCVTIFLAGYLLSVERKIKFNTEIKLAPLTCSLSTASQIFSCFVALFVLLRHGPALFALSGDRASSYEYYAREILDVYKLQLVFSLALVASTLRYIQTRKLISFYPLVPFVAIDVLQGGRGYSFAAIVVFGLNFLMLNMSRFKRVALALTLSVIFLFSSAFFRRYINVDETADPLLILFGEFFFTRLTGQIVYDNLASQGDLLTYFFVAISKLLPQFIVAPFFNEKDLVPYYVVVNDWVGAGFGLAGSIVSESIYYGGVGFGFFSPIIIATIFLFLNRSGFIFGLGGYLFFLILSSSMYLIFRTDFYSNFFSIIYKFLFYFSLIIVPSWRCRVFVQCLTSSCVKSRA